MAIRSYRPEDTVELPVRYPDEALALAAQLETAATNWEKPKPGKPRPLPELIDEARDEVRSLRAKLEEAAKPMASRPATIRAADLVEDNAVAATADWFRSFLRLPETTPERIEAAEIYGILFGDGSLEFLKLKPEREWAQVEARMNLIAEHKLAPRMEALGGKPFLKHLREAHHAYGIAVGTTAVPPAEAPPQVRATLLQLLDAIRVYVTRISSSIRKQDPETAVRADALLRPLMEWTTKPAPRKPAPESPPSS